MKIIIQVPTDRNPIGRYDWAVLFDGHRRELEQGIDFDCQPASFVRTVKRAACRQGISVETRSYLRDQEAVVAVKANPLS